MSDRLRLTLAAMRSASFRLEDARLQIDAGQPGLIRGRRSVERLERTVARLTERIIRLR